MGIMGEKVMLKYIYIYKSDGKQKRIYILIIYIYKICLYKHLFLQSLVVESQIPIDSKFNYMPK